MGKREFGGCRRIGIGRVQNHDAAFRGGGHVDVINPYASAADDFQPLTRRDRSGGDAGFRAHDNAVIVSNAPSEFRFAQSRGYRHLKSGP